MKGIKELIRAIIKVERLNYGCAHFLGDTEDGADMYFNFDKKTGLVWGRVKSENDFLRLITGQDKCNILDCGR